MALARTESLSWGSRGDFMTSSTLSQFSPESVSLGNCTNRKCRKTPRVSALYITESYFLKWKAFHDSGGMCWLKLAEVGQVECLYWEVSGEATGEAAALLAAGAGEGELLRVVSERNSQLQQVSHGALNCSSKQSEVKLRV